MAASNAFPITPSDTASLQSGTGNGIWIGGAGSGNLTVKMVSGAIVKFQALPAGVLLPICAVQVFATGTDVTSLIGLN